LIDKFAKIYAIVIKIRFFYQSFTCLSVGKAIESPLLHRSSAAVPNQSLGQKL